MTADSDAANPTNSTSALLNVRQYTHGDFQRNAEISQSLKGTLRRYIQPGSMSTIHLEALDMICLKLSRIGSGQASFRDHWDDIAGYAALAAKACPEALSVPPMEVNYEMSDTKGPGGVR